MQRVFSVRFGFKQLVALLLLTMIVLSFQVMTNRANAEPVDQYVETIGFTMGSDIAGAKTTWEITIWSNVNVDVGDELTIEALYYDSVLHDMIPIDFSSIAGDILINNVSVNSVETGSKTRTITSSVAFEAGEQATITLANTKNPPVGVREIGTSVWGQSGLYSTHYEDITFIPPPALTLEDYTAHAGETINIPLTLSGYGKFTAIQFQLEFDESFLEWIKPIGDTGMTYNEMEGWYNALIGSLENTAFTEVIDTLQFKVADDRRHHDETKVKVRNIVISDADGFTHVPDDTFASLTFEDNVLPKIELSVDTTDLATSVIVTAKTDGTGSNIATVKWMRGDVDLETIKATGTTLETYELPESVSYYEFIVSASLFYGEIIKIDGETIINRDDTFTVYTEDEAGNSAIQKITVNNVVLKGDAKNEIDGKGNWRVDIYDWQTVARFILGAEEPDPRQRFAADMDNNGQINVGDWVRIANWVVNPG